MNLTRLNTIKSYPIRDNSDILKILLKDRTTRKNIIWATDSYQDMGEGYQAKDHIKESLFKNGAGQIIKPRVEKDDEEQSKRTRGKGEVFTPTWIIKKKIDLIEEELSKLDLEDYIGQRWLEITCGEAPYMTSRYDTVTGEYLDIEERVGFLDRKLQRISKEIESEEIWYSLALKAYQASYGYEYQGDSLLIARENLLNSFIDYYVAKFNHIPGVDKLEAITRIISYNVFQMDGLKYRLPIVEKIRSEKRDVQLSFFGDMEMEDQQLEMVVDEGEEVKVKNWVNDRMIKFKDLVENKGGIGYMKFDVVIGNPPYQEDDNDSGKGSAMPVYNYFVESALDLEPQLISLITPSVWFTGGKGLSNFRNKMLNDVHIRFIHNFETPKDVFPNVSLRGGVNYFIWDSNFDNRNNKITVVNQRNHYKTKSNRIYKLPNVDIFIADNNGLSLLNKLINNNIISLDENDNLTMSSFVSARNPFGFTTKFVKSKNFYSTAHKLKDPIKIYASRGQVGYVERNLIKNNRELINKIKLITPFANNIGTDLPDDNLNSMVIEKDSIVTETYLVFDVKVFDSIDKAKHGQKYLKTKFVRCLISLAKANQNGTRKTYRFVPLQDFTPNSDIDWTKSIAEIDQQLYKKYGLDEDEINFIESNVKEME